MQMKRAGETLSQLRTVTLPEWAAPTFIFLVCVFSFGIVLSRLGFFQDDWHHVFYAYWQGDQGLQRFLLADRGPFAWVVYAMFFRILGYAPAAWHWSLMLIRFLTALVFWLALRQIWPGRSRLTAWLALMFVVYPIFTLQPLAVAYTLHWVMYLVFMISLLLMLSGARQSRYYVPLTAAAILLEAVHLAFIEYFSGLELCRLVFLWLLLQDLPTRERWRKTLRYAAPYLIVLALYVDYRSSYSDIFGYDRFTPLATLTDLFRAPLAGVAGILQSMFQDVVYVVLSQWYTAVNPAIIDLSRPSTYLIFGSMLAFAAAAYFVFKGLSSAKDGEGSDHSMRTLAFAGLAAIVLALLPFWLTGFSIYQKNPLWSERLALATMPGASMLVTGVVYVLIDQERSRHLVLSALLGLSIGLQVQTARSYQASWDKQEQFYWQMNWRAPALQPGTLIVSDQEILFYMGIYPTAFSINLLYPQTTQPPISSYWFNAGFEHVNFDEFSAGKPVTFEKYATTFTATVNDVMAITFEPGQNQCLWILGPQYTDVRDLTPEASTWLRVSNPSRILSTPGTVPTPAIYGREPKHTWCYYFEKADLAGQAQDWATATQLWDEANRQGMHAGNGVELMPFINAYARLNDWETARKLTMQAQSLPDRSTSALCDLWRGLATQPQASADRDQIVAAVEGQLGCQK
jgi:hypothetical protein